MISSYKTQIRGPYKHIRWFCDDGTVNEPKEPCEDGGVQRAAYKDAVIDLGRTNHIFLGQILSTTPIHEFWDEGCEQSRLKQYQMGQFLAGIDDGWVNRRAQYYRGAFQAEDEAAWGLDFFSWLLRDTYHLREHYYLMRQAALDIPHSEDDNVTRRVRAVSKEIADGYSAFMNLRVKIHGQPEESDIERVQAFRKEREGKLSARQEKQFNELIADMKELYKPVDAVEFSRYANRLPKGSNVANSLNAFAAAYPKASMEEERCQLLSQLTVDLRHGIFAELSAMDRLLVLDIANQLEGLLVRASTEWEAASVRMQIKKVEFLGAAAYGLGYLEPWEWQQLAPKLAPTADKLSLRQFNEVVEAARRAVEWGTGMVRGTYHDVISDYIGFEPLASGMLDDKARGSILLQMGAAASELGDIFAREAGFANKVNGVRDQSAMRGLNPGYAMGELVVTKDASEGQVIHSDKIYVFDRPPGDLKPVAGIATVSEGNMVSHVQLLARNLGIPNAVLSTDNLNDLMALNGTQVFYAVSNKGTVVMKPASQMTAAEQALFSKKARKEEMISVSTDRIVLDQPSVIDMRDVDAAQSGRLCGPKAANLGQLKRLFPENVVEGLVIPFSVFRQHFDQNMPGSQKSYWKHLNEIFAQADNMKDSGIGAEAIENYVLKQLEAFRAAIARMPLLPSFEADLREKFKTVLCGDMGKVPVFLRSDTNMEDLKDFTGAGLNLTLFNVKDPQKIFDGIRSVWASPYTERSYRWRQRYLLNPENVFPSILIIPSVNADYSGVLITKGVASGNEDELTAAFNRGVGGAVDGQASETWSLTPNGVNALITPAREAQYITIPATGGTQKGYTSFQDPLLSYQNLTDLREMAAQIRQRLGRIGMKSPYDVELGFKDDHIWLFQVRPFVENKRAAASDYLRSITPNIDWTKTVQLNNSL